MQNGCDELNYELHKSLSNIVSAPQGTEYGMILQSLNTAMECLC